MGIEATLVAVVVALVGAGALIFAQRLLFQVRT